MSGYSYRHLYYFWVVAKEGGMARAAQRLDMAVQTVSAQVRELERSLGHELLRPAGRGLALTAAGVAAMRQADLIFQLGERLPEVVREAGASPVVRLAAGVSDGLPKLVTLSLLQPVLNEPNLRLLCHVGEFQSLLGELSLHRLDIVFADRPAPPNPNLKLYSHVLGSSRMAWYAPKRLLAAARRGFPASLGTVPLLLPTAHGAVRIRLDHWFEREGIEPRVVGEFEDSALLKAFASSGMGVFPAPVLIRKAIAAQYGAHVIGPCGDVEEHFYAIGTERKVQHPLVLRLLPRIPHARSTADARTARRAV